MNNSPFANSISVSVRIYRAMLAAYPRKFREHYETHMVQVFRDSFKYEYHRNGKSGVIDLWLHTCADLLVTALMERISERSQYMFSPKVILWGGLAGVFSGMLWVMVGLAPSSGAATFVLALVLGLGGLAALYSRQAGQSGRLGLAGFALGIIGTVLALAALWWGFTSGRLTPARVATPEATAILNICLGLVILGVGLALLGVASLRANTLHRWRGLPLGLGLLNILSAMTIWIVYYVPLSQGQNPWDPWNPGAYMLPNAVNVLVGLGWMGLGITLAAEAETRITQPPPASA